jgi:hypothetical protein
MNESVAGGILMALGAGILALTLITRLYSSKVPESAAEREQRLTRKAVDKWIEAQYRDIMRDVRDHAKLGTWCTRVWNESMIHDMNIVRLRSEGFTVDAQGISWELP